MHIVLVLSQFILKYEKQHWLAAKQTLYCLIRTVDDRITYKTGDVSLIGYLDTNFANDETDWRSLTGYVFKIGDVTIT